MNPHISTIWKHPAPGFVMKNVQNILLKSSDKDAPLQVFFRADDIGYVDEYFSRLMHTFLSHQMPLCLAVVPEWLSHENWKAMEEFEPQNPLWCWHQHGLSHSNHELQGKKCEFGDSRSRDEISQDLCRGRELLASVMGDLFCPVFTPPWNRCSFTTLALLEELDYLAVSRSQGAKPAARNILPDIAVNIDLHTRKESSYTRCWDRFLEEFDTAVNDGRVGFMLHHQRMNEHAFSFLESLLSKLRLCDNVSCCTFKELL